MENRFFEIGVISNTHGIKGVLKVFPTTDYPERFKKLKKVFVELRGKTEVHNVENVWYHKQFVLLKLSGIDSMTDAEAYKTGRILIEESDAVPLEENEYYVRDLYDMEVFTEEGELLGIIKDVFPTGANDVYVISKEGEPDLLIPAIKDCILNVDVAGRKMTVRLLKGLR